MKNSGLQPVDSNGSPRPDYYDSVVVAASHPLGWHGLTVAHGYSTRFEPCELRFPGHYLAINLARTPLRVEVKTGSRTTSHTVAPDGIWIAPAGEAFTQRNCGPSLWAGLQFPVARACEILGDRLDLVPAIGTSDLQLATGMHALLVQLDLHGERAHPLELEGLLVEIITRLAECHGMQHGAAGALAGQRLRRVEELIEDTLDQAVTVEQMAAVAGLSTAHFAREFKRATRQTPHERVMSLRLDRARRLLEAGSPVADAAATAGFADQSHLCRRFKERFGATPTEYRRLADSRTIQVPRQLRAVG